MADILIVDDNEAFCGLLKKQLNQLGHKVDYTFSLIDGLQMAQEGGYEVVFLDVNLPDGNGVVAIQTFRRVRSSPEVIIITALGDPDGAELAIKHGAWDYIQKGGSLQSVLLPFERVMQYRGEKRSARVAVNLDRSRIIGNSDTIQRCLDKVAHAAMTVGNVLISGETGTGKELFARAIHDNSARSGHAFVVVDCTALPETLVESLLFGHVRGSFTGANQDRTGLVRQANGGTLFLDEIGDLPMSLQKTFLRVLEERTYRPLGSTRLEQSDFRLIAATNCDLEALVKAGEFRADLLFRLQSIVIGLPPLRERLDDLRDVVTHHIIRICDRLGIEPKTPSPDFLHALRSYTWPGNVRELVNVLESSIAAARFEQTLFSMHLPLEMRVRVARASTMNSRVPDSGTGRLPQSFTLVAGDNDRPSDDAFPTLKDVRTKAADKAEKTYLTELMSRTDWDMGESCRAAGLKRARLYSLLRKHNISRS